MYKWNHVTAADGLMKQKLVSNEYGIFHFAVVISISYAKVTTKYQSIRSKGPWNSRIV